MVLHLDADGLMGLQRGMHLKHSLVTAVWSDLNKFSIHVWNIQEKCWTNVSHL